METLIFANGTSGLPDDILLLVRRAGLVIAADGGANYCFEINILPHAIIGDFDSVKPTLLKHYENKNVAIHRHPERKNATDLELALDLAMDQGATSIVIAGALGGRWDMSFANILLTASSKYKGVHIMFCDKTCSIRIHHPTIEYFFENHINQTISFLPINDEITGITLKGFEYPLTNHTLKFGSTHGISNIIVSDNATARHLSGTLISILSIDSS